MAIKISKFRYLSNSRGDMIVKISEDNSNLSLII